MDKEHFRFILKRVPRLIFQQKIFIMNCVLSMVIRLLRSQQLNGGISDLMKAGKEFKMNCDLAGLLPKE